MAILLSKVQLLTQVSPANPDCVSKVWSPYITTSPD